MFSRFFIDRPIFASVLSIVITLAGGIVLFTLPVTLYPDITPPTVEVSASYPGANAQVVVDTVAAPIEQQVNGVEGMIYMSSSSADDGSYSLNVTFEIGTDMDMATVLVQTGTLKKGDIVTIYMPMVPELAVAMLDALNRCNVKSTWCTLYPGGYPSDFYRRLQELKAHYDPDNRFSHSYDLAGTNSTQRT